jgi:hypothetical protein
MISTVEPMAMDMQIGGKKRGPKKGSHQKKRTHHKKRQVKKGKKTMKKSRKVRRR